MRLRSQRAGGAASMVSAVFAAALVLGSAGSAAADCAATIAALEKKISAENPGLGGMPGDPAAASALTPPAGAAPAPAAPAGRTPSPPPTPPAPMPRSATRRSPAPSRR